MEGTTLRDPGEQHSRYRVDEAFYDRVRASERRMSEQIVVPPLSGRALVVERGQAFRIIEADGPQAGDVAFWNADDPDESLSCLRTWELEGWFLRPNTRLWSDVPWLRPMATCIEETVGSRKDGEAYHHHFLASQCSPESLEMRTGRAGMRSCRLALLEAVEPFGLGEENLRENIDVFTRFVFEADTGKIYTARTEAAPGDYVELYAEIDLLVAVSACPAGDMTSIQSDDVSSLRIEVYETGIAPRELPKWTEWRDPVELGKVRDQHP